MDIVPAVLIAAIPAAVALLIAATYALRIRKDPLHPENALRRLGWSAKMRVSRAVLLGERLSNPDEAQVAVAMAQRRLDRPWEHPLFPILGVTAAYASFALFDRLRGLPSESSLLTVVLGVFLAFVILVPLEVRGARRAQKLNHEVVAEPGREWQPTKRAGLALLLAITLLLFVLFLVVVAILDPDPTFIAISVVPVVLFHSAVLFLFRRR
jgi:hypothetical protein